MLICGIVTLLIALAGLIGYIHNETNRRRAEIAIRKVHGATTNSIQGLFFKNILITVIPAIIVGLISAVVVVQLLQENFIDKVYISIFGYTLCAVCIASISLAVTIILSWTEKLNTKQNFVKNTFPGLRAAYSPLLLSRGSFLASIALRCAWTAALLLWRR
jgi:ABC-type antimicrobial peptide transport system permease subunit